MKLQILVTRSLKNSRKLDLTPGKVIILHKNKNKKSKPVNEGLERGASRSASPRAKLSKTVGTRISAQFNINYGSIV